MVWAHDLLRGQKPTDMTKQSNIVRTMSGSGFLGYPAMILSGLFDVYPSQYSGTFSQTPAGSIYKRGAKVKNELVKAWKSGNWDKFWYVLAEELRKSSGVGNMWWLRGMTTQALEDMMLTPAQEEAIDAKREAYRRKAK